VYNFQGLRHDSVSGLDEARHRWYSSALGRFTSLDPIGFSGGNNNVYGFVDENPINSTDASGTQRDEKPKGVTMGWIIRYWLASVIGNSKDNFGPTQVGLAALDIYNDFCGQVDKQTGGRGRVIVRVFRPLFSGPLFNVSQLQPADRNIAIYPFDGGPWSVFTIKPFLFIPPVRVYQADPWNTYPKNRCVCHGVSMGVSGPGDIDVGSFIEKFGLGFGIFPTPDNLLPYWITYAALWGGAPSLIIPPATADQLFTNPWLYQEVSLSDIRPGDIIAFYTSADAGYGFPAGSIIHSFPVTGVNLAPPPRPVK
jgi:RHS repeat-associated protein